MNKKGTTSGAAVANDTKTVLVSGKSATMTFPLNATLKDSAYIVVSDKAHRIIASKMVQITPTVADLHLNGITVDAGAASTSVDGIDFQRVNNTTATVTVTLTNGSQGTYCQPNMQCFLQKYDAEAKTWTNVKNIIQNTYIFDAGQTLPVDFVFTGLSEEVFYRAYLNDKAVASVQSDIAIDTDAPYVYFTVQQPDLTIITEGRNATVTGHWNASLFTEQATDARVCSYDISGLADLNEKPIAANPNALFFTNTPVSGIVNVVVGDVCEQLTIQTAADFMPLRPFTARHASLTLTEAEPGKWHGALIPFAAEVPYGMQMKQATEYIANKSIISHEATRNVEPMTVVTFLTSRPSLNTITATDVAIGDLQAPAYTDTMAVYFDGLLRACTVSTPLEPQSLVLGEYVSMLYFIAPEASQTTVDAFKPIVVGAATQRVRTTTETLADGYYRTLSSTIAKAYAALDENAKSAAAREALLTEVKVAEYMLTYRSHEVEADINNENAVLEKAIKTFVESADKEVITGDVNGDGNVDVADIASVIDVMTGIAADPELARNADVNSDTVVNVADIATIIDIMAGKP